MQKVTIADLERGKDRDPIWALNGSTSSPDIAQPGDVHVQIPKGNGTKSDDLVLDQTWLPICLTEQIPRQQLLAASEFRVAVRKGLIQLITEEDAKAILSQDGADEEDERIKEAKRRVREASAAKGINEDNVQVISHEEIKEKETEQVGPESNPQFLMFVDSLEGKNDIQTLNLIRSRGKFKRSEIQHLAKVLVDKPKTVSFLKAKLV